MPRTIIRPRPRDKATSFGTPAEEKKDEFLGKLAKYIPAEINAAYLFMAGIISSISNVPPLVLWIVFLALAITAPFYFWFVAAKEKVDPDKAQIVISPFAFFIWVFAIGGPFAAYSWYNQAYGAILLGFATVLIPMVDFLITRKAK